MPVFIVEIAVESVRRCGLKASLKPWQQEKRHQEQMKTEKEHRISGIPVVQPRNAPLKPAAHPRDCRANYPE